MTNPSPSENGSRRRRFFILLPPAILVVAALVALVMVKTKPKAKRRPASERASAVKVITIEPSTERILLQANGTVVPAQIVSLKPRVSGEVTWIHPQFLPGGRFQVGDELLRIDDSDYRLAVENRKADVAQADRDLKLERGQQDIAMHEWNLIEDRTAATETDVELALRKPYLKSAEAKLASAKASLELAELNMERTHIRAPFNGVIVSRQVDAGEQVTVQTELGQIAGADAYWIDVTIPADRLQWVALPDAAGTGGADVRIMPAGGIEAEAEWAGTVIQRKPDLESEGRQAQLLVSVANPLDRTSPTGGSLPLLLGSYVRVEIEGPEIGDVYKVPRSAIHNGSNVWIMAGSRLEIRPIGTAWRSDDDVLVNDGLKPGDKIVVSRLSAPIAGMLLEMDRPLTTGPKDPAAGGGSRP